MNSLKKQNYRTPEVEVLMIELEQSVLTYSIEDIGPTHPDQDWIN